MRERRQMGPICRPVGPVATRANICKTKNPVQLCDKCVHAYGFASVLLVSIEKVYEGFSDVFNLNPILKL